MELSKDCCLEPGNLGIPPGTRHEGSHRRASAGWALTHGQSPRKYHRVPAAHHLQTKACRLHCQMAGGGDLARHSDPWHSKPVLGMWDVTSLVGKELVLVQVMEQDRLDIVSRDQSQDLQTRVYGSLLDNGGLEF